MWLALCLSPLSSKVTVSLVGRGYSWMGDHLTFGYIALMMILELGTRASRVVVVGLSRASRVFLRGSPVFLPP